MKFNKFLICMLILGISLLMCSVALAESKKMFTTDDVTVYVKPDTSSTAVMKIEKAYEVEIVKSYDNNWNEIRYNKKNGYIEKQYLSDEDPIISEIDVKKLRFGTLTDNRKPGEVNLINLYKDAELTIIINPTDFYSTPQRVVILENSKKVKKIAAFGEEAYVPAANITNISSRYKKERDYGALQQYALTLRANEYRKDWESDPYFGKLNYDYLSRTCVIHYKKGKMPSFPLKPGFRLEECNFSRIELNSAIQKIEAIAQKHGLVKERDYVIFILEYNLTIDVNLIDDAGAKMEQFQRDINNAGIDPKMYCLGLYVV